MSWHIYGLLYRQDHNHPEAAKCYKRALTFDPENNQILRDMASACLHLRDFRQLAEVRRVLLTSKSNMGSHWIGLAQAHQLAGNTALALAVLEQYENTQEPGRPPSYEMSEINLYKARLLEQGGQTVRALKVLNDGLASGVITDRLAAQEKRAELYLRLNRPATALEGFAELLRVNPEHWGYHAGLQAAVLGLSGDELLAHQAAGEVPASARAAAGRLSGDDVSKLLAVYAALAAADPKARSHRRLILDFLPSSHPAFAPLAGAYIRDALRKGIPSLWSDLKPLYRAPAERGLGWTGRQQWRQAVASAGAGGSDDAVQAAMASEKAAVLGKLVISYAAACAAESSSGKMPSAALDASALLPELKTAVAASKVLNPPPSPAAAPAASSATSADGSSGSSSDSDSNGNGSDSEDTIKLPGGIGALTSAGLAALAANKGDDDACEHPSTLPWAVMLAARHEDEVGDVTAALARLEAGIGHTPTVIELYVSKARCLKHAGALTSAADAMDYARSLDLADRWLNTKATKYQLRAGRTDVAESTIALFVRHDSKDPASDPLGNLREMQALWYECEAGEAHERAGALGPALKHFARVESHFKDMLEDELDFYFYVHRKFTLRAYADLLAVEDNSRGHAYWLRARMGAARCHYALWLDGEARKGTARYAAASTASSAAAAAAAAAVLADGAVASSASPHAELAAAADGAMAAADVSGSSSLTSRKRAQADAMTSGRTRAAVATAAAQAAAYAKKNASGGSGGDDEAASSKAKKDRDDDPLGDKLVAPPSLAAAAAGGSDSAALAAHHLEEAAKAVRSVVANLPGGLSALPDRLAVSAGLEGGAGAPRQPVPSAGSPIRGPSASRYKRSRGWNIGPDFALAAHALAADVSIARGKLAQAAAHLAGAKTAAAGSNGLRLAEMQAAASSSASSISSSSCRELAHPLVARTAARLLRALTSVPAGPLAEALAEAVSTKCGLGERLTSEAIATSLEAQAAPSLSSALAAAQLRLEAAGFPILPDGVSPAVSLAPPAFTGISGDGAAAASVMSAVRALASRPLGRYAGGAPSLAEAEAAYAFLSVAAASGVKGAVEAADEFAASAATFPALSRSEAFVLVPSSILAGQQPVAPSNASSAAATAAVPAKAAAGAGAKA